MTNLTAESSTLSGGTRYGFFKGDDFYGVVDNLGAERTIVARFPLSSAGWFEARRRCEELERDAAAAALKGAPTAVGLTEPLLVPVLLVAAGVLLGVIGLFPKYSQLGGLATHPDQLVGHLSYLLGWTAAAGVMAWHRQLSRVAAAFGVGLSAMSVGFFLTDVASIASTSGDTAGPGIYLSLVGWALCSIGSATAVFSTWSAVRRSDAAPLHHWRALSAAIVAALSVVTFALPWDRYQVVVGATGQSQTVTAGNAFSNPGSLIACELIVMAAMVVLLVWPVLMRSLHLAAAVFAGALVPLVAQVFSAALEPAPSLSAFGISPQAAVQQAVRLGAGFTTWFYLYCLSIALLILLGAWMVFAARASDEAAAPTR